MRNLKPIATKRSQQGITLVLISLVMLILIGMGAFAMDLNHQVLNKARLQNAVDSAALASAVVADDTSDVDLAEAAAISALNSFAVASGNQELVYTVEDNIEVTFSNDKQTFVDADSFTFGSNDNDIYVRVAVSDLPLTQYLSFIFGISKSVSASAVAGPSAPITSTCNISPVAMCGLSTSSDLAWGYIPSSNPDYEAKTDKIADTIHVLKPSGHKDGGIGPGNYHLLDFGSGKNTVEDLLAGVSDTCLSVGDIVETEPGKGVGKVSKGLNTRFDTSTNYTDTGEVIKPDKYLEESDVSYENYKDEYENYTENAFYYADYYSSLKSCESGGACKEQYYEASGQIDRRVLRVPIVDCDSTTKAGGKMDLKVFGIGCFFITQQVSNKGNESEIFGQFLEDCTVKNASTGVDPSDTIGPYKIQLYKDPLRGES